MLFIMLVPNDTLSKCVHMPVFSFELNLNRKYHFLSPLLSNNHAPHDHADCKDSSSSEVV